MLRLLTGTFASITPVLADLRWLPIKYRIDFKILLLTFNIINNIAPSYLADRLSLYRLVYGGRYRCYLAHTPGLISAWY